jgi:hypothetical protein
MLVVRTDEGPEVSGGPVASREPAMADTETSADRSDGRAALPEQAPTTELEGKSVVGEEELAAEVVVKHWWRVLGKRRRRSPGVSAASVEPSRVEPVDRLRLHRFAVDSLAKLATELDASDAEDTDLVLVMPVGGTQVVADSDELVEAARLTGGICVAASAVPLASPAIAEQVEMALREATGSPVLRCHPHPYGFVGSAGSLRLLLADLVDWGSDADRLTTAVLSGRHDVVLDISSQIFHVWDGTGTDLIMVAGRAHVGDERPLVLIDLSLDGRGQAPTDPAPVARRGREAGPDVRPQSSRELGLYTFTVDSLAQLSSELDAAGAEDADVVLVLPAQAAMVVVEPGELVEAARLSGGICVAASPVTLASPPVAQEVERVVAEATGSPVLRCHPHPYGLVGPAGALRTLLADMPEWGSDADRLTAVILSGRHDVVLDVGSQFFHVADGTGTDVMMVAGRAHAGDEQPLVLIDSNPDGRALALIKPDPVDGSARDLARLLRYDGAVAAGDEVATAAAPDVLVMPLWTPEFCATVIRAAEAAALWVNLTDDPAATVGTWLHDLVPRLCALLRTDLDNRIWPLLHAKWPTVVHAEVHGARILRYPAGGPLEDPIGGHDAAYLCGSVRLNRGYHGGALVLPSQGWDDSAVPVGALTVWPPLAAQSSETASVTRGVKYRLALWWCLPDG